jgi:SpoVK/Ycf46/Vps4 family AAA+-type ATPase
MPKKSLIEAFKKKFMGKETKPVNNPKSPNTNPPPNNGGNGNDIVVRVGDCFTNNSSKKIYQVIRFERREVEGGFIPMVVFVGLDSREWKLNVKAFLEKFSRVPIPKQSPDELAKIKEMAERESQESPQQKEEDEKLMGELFMPSEKYSFEKLILQDETKESILSGVNSIMKRKQIEEIWGLSKSNLDIGNKMILNFFGASGTGKSLTAKTIASHLKKPLLWVDYAKIVDKYVGQTAKHISAVFAAAKEKDAILFFDEADSLLSKRVDMSVNSDYANSVNQNRNVLMQELDKFENVVIMTTNFFNNYDEAMLRRINKHVEFKLPDKKMRENLYLLHMPNMDRVKDVDFKVVSELSKGFSGGDIRNVCANAIEAACQDENPEKWFLTMDLFEKQIKGIRGAKDSHKKSNSNSEFKEKEPIGFFQPVKVAIEE